MKDNLLKNSPLIEVLAEFNFNESQKDVLNQAKDELSKQYANFTFSETKLEVFTFSPTLEPSKTEQKRFQLKNSADNQMIQIDEGLIAINFLEPYSGWESFSNFTYDLLNFYSSIISNKKSIKTINLRYINRLNLNTNYPSEYININSQLCDFIENRKGNIENFNNTYVIKLDEGRRLIANYLSSYIGTTPSFLLDFTFSSNGSYSFDNLNDVKIELEEGHKRIIEIFESIITKNFVEKYK